jgi:hypothetical protein
MPTMPENGARMRVLSKPGLRQRQRRFLYLECRLRVVECLPADEVPGKQILGPLVIGLRESQTGPRLVQFCHLRGGVEREQQ